MWGKCEVFSDCKYGTYLLQRTREEMGNLMEVVSFIATKLELG